MSTTAENTSETAPREVVVVKGVSPLQDAWRRLKKNRMAMFGFYAILIMTFLCVFAPLLPTVRDPAQQFNYAADEPALTSHPLVLTKNQLVVGEEPQLPKDLLSASEVAFDVEKILYTTFRIVKRRRKIRTIGSDKGAERFEQLKAAGTAEDYLVEELKGGEIAKEPLPADTLFEVGKKPPKAMGKKKVMFVRHVIPGRGLQKVAATLTDGKITKITIDGEEIMKFSFDGKDVKVATADGKEQRVMHLLGTDASGRDLFSRVLYGGRISLMVGLVATLVSLLIGVVYGAVSGFYGGKLDALLMAIVDILYGVPYLFLVILLLVFFGRDIFILFVALGAVQWLTMARIVRGQVLSLKQKEFVEAARMSGTSDAGIVFGHLIPNTLGVVVVYTTLTIPAVILQESFLAFIGLSVEFQGKSLESWGALVKSGADALGDSGERSWLLLWPSLAMAITLFSMNFLGDGLRDALDPQQRGRT